MKTLISACFSFFFLYVVHSFAKNSVTIPSSVNQKNAVNQGKSINWSEKLYSESVEGLRVIWTGSELLTVNNEQIKAPDWFVEPLPSYSLDGILWTPKNQLASLNEIVTSAKSQGWSKIKFMLLDLPESSDIFIERHLHLKELSQKLEQPYIEIVPHFPARNEPYLLEQLNGILQAGGSGVTIRDVNETYQPNRIQNALKLQDWQSSQAVVMGYEYYAKGKHIGKVNRLKVKTLNGKILLISSGLSSTDRIYPPEVGSKIIYSYNGQTKNGAPILVRFKKILVNDK